MAAATAITAGVIVAATAAKVYGDYKANKAQAKADKANSLFYMEQADFARDATERELSIYQQQASEFFGQQVSSISKGGVALTGSPLLALADTKFRAAREEEAIMLDGRAKIREAKLKAGFSARQAQAIEGTQGLQAAGTSLTGLANAYTMAGSGGSSSKGKSTPSTSSSSSSGIQSGSTGFRNGNVA